MHPYDLCANTVSLNHDQKQFANTVLWERLNLVSQLYEQHGASGNLYIGGSVGLLQPSLRCENGTPVTVKSDLDLFYLCQNLPPSPEEEAFLEAVSRLPEDVDVSIHLMPAVHLEGSPYSLALDDLRASIERPLRKGFDFKFPPRVNTHERKTVILAAASYYAAGFIPYYIATHKYANVEGNRVPCGPSNADKAATILLRIPCYEHLGERFSHRAVQDLANEGFFDGICPPTLITEVFTRREQVDASLPPLSLSVGELFDRVFSHLLSLPEGTPRDKIAAKIISTDIFEETSVDTVHSLVLAMALWLDNPGQETVDLVSQQRPRFAFLPEDLRQELEQWEADPKLELGRELCIKFKSLSMMLITERTTALVAQAYQKRAI